jgi:hypothetical protein
MVLDPACPALSQQYKPDGVLAQLKAKPQCGGADAPALTWPARAILKRFAAGTKRWRQPNKEVDMTP